MAYFDSPKNQAIWKKEIERMKIEREKRRLNGFKSVSPGGESGEADRELPHGVRKIDFKELERIVRQKKGLSGRGMNTGEREVRERGRARENADKVHERSETFI